MAPALILAATITVHTAFDGGSAGPVQHVGPAHLRVGVKGDKDQNGRNRQASWYFFEVRGAQPGQPLTIDMVDLPGEYNFKPNRGAITGDTPPLVSYDGRTWIHIDNVTYDATEPHLRLRLTPLGPKFRIAHTPPYTNGDLERLRRHALTHGASEEVIGTSPEGRPLLLWTIGTGSKTVWLMFRQHAWESGTSYVGEGAVHELLRDSRGIRWKVFPMCDPDGVAHGRVRFNARGFDLNRNWDTLDSTSMPEIAAQHAAVAKWIKSGHGIDLFLTLHNTETSEYLQGPPGQMPPVGTKLTEMLLKHTAFTPTRPVFSAETETAPGRMTVVQGLHRDFGIPAFLMEQRIARDPKLGRLPSVPERMVFGKALVHAIAEALCCGR